MSRNRYSDVRVNLFGHSCLKLYMAMGGIPHYLKKVRAARSVIQNIDYLCFSNAGILTDEFSKLYPSLFEKADNHIAVVRALAQKRKGLVRKDIIEIAKITNGGGTTRVVEELEQSGFITSYHPFGKKKKEKLYQLTDEYSLPLLGDDNYFWKGFLIKMEKRPFWQFSIFKNG